MKLQVEVGILRLRLIFALTAQRSVLAQDDIFFNCLRAASLLLGDVRSFGAPFGRLRMTSREQKPADFTAGAAFHRLFLFPVSILWVPPGVLTEERASPG
jgi:hypothetical protein